MKLNTKKRVAFRVTHLKYKILLDVIQRRLIVPLMRFWFRIRCYTPFLRNLKGAYILLPCHSTSLDPFLVHPFTRRKIHFVASNAQFRTPLMRWVMRQGGTVAIKKGQFDFLALKEILYLLHTKREPICIFPEGVNTWDGTSQAILGGTATLVKKAGVSVISAHSHGAYLTYPRWATKLRRGEIHITFKLCLTPKRIAEMNKQEIMQTITQALTHNEFNKQHSPITITSSRRAEYVERVLFACPYCSQVQGIVSRKRSFYCIHCLHEWFVDLSGFFRTCSAQEPVLPDYHDVERSLQHIDINMATWNKWQKEFLIFYISKIPSRGIIFKDEHCILQYGVSRPSITLGVGRLVLTSDYLYLIPYDSFDNVFLTKKFSISQLKATNVQNKEKLEWSREGSTIFFQVISKNPRVNMYKYMLAIHHLQKQSYEQLKLYDNISRI